jgi:hypothetical protein
MSHRQTRMERAKAQPSPALTDSQFQSLRSLDISPPPALKNPGKTSYFWRLPALATAWF